MPTAKKPTKNSLEAIRSRFAAAGSAEQAAIAQRFFKTGPGEYGEGDKFLGLTVPQVRSFIRESDALLSLLQLESLLHSEWHEERLLALLCLVHRFERATKSPDIQKEIFDLYLSNTRWINNWDLVDTSAPQIVGGWLLEHDRSILKRLARSQSLWEQRISILATFTFIRRGDNAVTQELCVGFLNHKHDLMHKACGWMLREVGKRDEGALTAFLDAHAGAMPRTMLRYALEKLTPTQRQHYMKLPRRVSNRG